MVSRLRVARLSSRFVESSVSHFLCTDLWIILMELNMQSGVIYFSWNNPLIFSPSPVTFDFQSIDFVTISGSRFVSLLLACHVMWKCSWEATCQLCHLAKKSLSLKVENPKVIVTTYWPLISIQRSGRAREQIVRDYFGCWSMVKGKGNRRRF